MSDKNCAVHAGVHGAGPKRTTGVKGDLNRYDGARTQAFISAYESAPRGIAR